MVLEFNHYVSVNAQLSWQLELNHVLVLAVEAHLILHLIDVFVYLF